MHWINGAQVGAVALFRLILIGELSLLLLRTFHALN
jgi:hypothetical protein